MEWSKKNLGLTVPYPSDNYVKPVIKGAKKAQKKNDDKSPEAQLIKLREEMRPKMIFEFFKQEDKVKKKGKKKKIRIIYRPDCHPRCPRGHRGL